ncbi:EAL and HDOD domain-containing protein [Glaciecola sp. 1036]|uniref:EAL and HDOD domain-containing protein n=1 Tax=Alteromonadaceae TaxID=72275 RepID=UPI003D0299DF
MIVFAREPIFTSNEKVFAYQLVFNESIGHVFDPENIKLARSPEDTGGVAWPQLLEGFTSLITITKEQLFNPIPEDFPPDDTMLEIDKFDEDDPAFVERINALKKIGYRIIAGDKNPLSEFVIKHCDILKVSINKISPYEVKELRNQTINPKIKLIVTDVQTQASFKKCVEVGFDYYQGYFFLTRKKTNHSDELPANKVAIFNLISQISQPSLDMKKIRVIFEHDATLTYLLMRFINNPMINKYHEIKSIKHALAYLGEVMLRKFVAIVSLAQLNTGNTSELLQVALIRAKFCESISETHDGKEESLSAFLTGLFSLIDVILDRDMAILMDKVQLALEIKLALTQKQGTLHHYVKICQGIESAHWQTLKQNCEQVEVEHEIAKSVYLESVRWANSFSIPESNVYPVARVH